MIYKRIFKPLFDFIIALTGFIFVFPVFLVIVVILLIANRGKPFFLQPRPGINKKIFKIIKFKTMNDRKDERGNLLPDAKRLTTIGEFIRKTSLDEIPQLLNVLIGDMSLIGPRPLLIKYLPYYSNEETIRFSVKPGISGWAQINGRNNLTWDKRLACDVYYVKHLSFLFDLKIFFLTIKNVLISKDIAVDTACIMLDLDQERINTYASNET